MRMKKKHTYTHIYNNARKDFRWYGTRCQNCIKNIRVNNLCIVGVLAYYTENRINIRIEFVPRSYIRMCAEEFGLRLGDSVTDVCETYNI